METKTAQNKINTVNSRAFHGRTVLHEEERYKKLSVMPETYNSNGSNRRLDDDASRELT